MPHWALGRLMDLAVDLAGMTRSLRPAGARKTIVTMAGDHGVAAEGVSKYPQEVTAQWSTASRRHGGHQRPGRAGRGRVIVSSIWALPPTSVRWRGREDHAKKIARERPTSRRARR